MSLYVLSYIIYNYCTNLIQIQKRSLEMSISLLKNIKISQIYPSKYSELFIPDYDDFFW